VNNANALGSAGTRTLNIAGGTLDNTSGGDITTVNPAININGDFTFGGTNNLNLGTGATTLGTAAGTTRTITANGTTIALTIGGVIANGTTANSLTKAGTGTLILGGANTFDGLTTVSGGTLRIAANDRIANASDLLLDGGTFDTGGFAETMDLLALSNNSAIEFGTGTSIVNFAALGTFDTTKTLQLLGWSGLDTGSGTDQLFVGTSAALSASELAAIQFVNPTNYLPGTYVATQLSSGEIVAVIPEPASLGLLAMAGLSLLRRRRA
jgi:autotransporter-associated beta strand protein